MIVNIFCFWKMFQSKVMSTKDASMLGSTSTLHMDVRIAEPPPLLSTICPKFANSLPPVCDCERLLWTTPKHCYTLHSQLFDRALILRIMVG